MDGNFFSCPLHTSAHPYSSARPHPFPLILYLCYTHNGCGLSERLPITSYRLHLPSTPSYTFPARLEHCTTMARQRSNTVQPKPARRLVHKASASTSGDAQLANFPLALSATVSIQTIQTRSSGSAGQRESLQSIKPTERYYTPDEMGMSFTWILGKAYWTFSTIWHERGPS